APSFETRRIGLQDEPRLARCLSGVERRLPNRWPFRSGAPAPSLGTSSQSNQGRARFLIFDFLFLIDLKCEPVALPDPVSSGCWELVAPSPGSSGAWRRGRPPAILLNRMGFFR